MHPPTTPSATSRARVKLGSLCAGRSDVLAHAVRAVEPRSPLRPLGMLRARRLWLTPPWAVCFRASIPREPGDAVTGRLVASAVNLNKPPYYIHWGVIQLSLANLIVIALMLVVFALALIVPFPKGRGGP
jgi:hypothetical protein